MILLYTVKEVSSLSGVTVKALHHYHAIGLLPPCQISEAGYRLYGEAELQRLQRILFYRELEIPLGKIKALLAGKPDLSILGEQRELLLARRKRLDMILRTLESTVLHTEKGEIMDKKAMFSGFQTQEEWKDALKEQTEHLRDTYGYEPDMDAIDAEEMNESAAEAAAYMAGMAEALREGVRHDDERVRRLIGSHLEFMGKHGHSFTAAELAAQCRFFLTDDFHLSMLEGQQTGLAYYVSAAADAYADR